MLERAPVEFAPLLPSLFLVLEDDGEGLTAESEDVLTRLHHILERWGPAGAEPLLLLFESSKKKKRTFSYQSYAEELLLDVYGNVPEVMDRLRTTLGNRVDRHWKRGPTQEEGRENLLRTLREQILPDGWI